MFTKTRQEEILKLVNAKQSVTVKELMETFDASQSTIQRDIVSLDGKGLLTKVFGGAVAKNEKSVLTEMSSVEKRGKYTQEKIKIAKYAATLIEPNDLVYIDAGTTTEYMLDFIEEKQATYVTNGIEHAKKLANLDFNVILIGGILKKTTEAILGSGAILSVQKYHFTKGFFATNGVHKEFSFTTPDINEASMKKAAIDRVYKKYMLCDESKFDKICGVEFATIDDFTIITNKDIIGYDCNIIVATD